MARLERRRPLADRPPDRPPDDRLPTGRPPNDRLPLASYPFLPMAIIVVTGFRVAYAMSRELVPDEAYYWVWSRHLALGYFDHPPVVAYLIRLGTLIFGNTELGVRFFAVATALGGVLVILGLARRMGVDRGTTQMIGWILLASPLVQVLGGIMSPDSPACFFGACALASAIIAVSNKTGDQIEGEPTAAAASRKEKADASNDVSSGTSVEKSKPAASRGDLDSRRAITPRGPRELHGSRQALRDRIAAAVSIIGRPFNDSRPEFWWPLFGVAMGLTVASKYTGVLLGVAILAAMLTSTRGRAEFKKPWVWLAAVIALVVFSPVVYWNWRHHWSSFAFQLHHGMSEDESSSPPRNVPEFIGGQAVVWTPILFVLVLITLASLWRRVRDLPMQDRMLLWSASVPLAFFFYSSFRHRVEANWPVMAYFPAAILLARQAGAQWKAPFAHWLRIGVIVAAVMTAVLHFPELSRYLPGRTMPSKWADLFGWRDFAKDLDRVRGAGFAAAPVGDAGGEGSGGAGGGGNTFGRAGDDRLNFDGDGAGNPDAEGSGNVTGLSNGAAGGPAMAPLLVNTAPVYSSAYQLASEASFYMAGQPDCWMIDNNDRPTAFDDFPGRPDPATQPRVVFARKTTLDRDLPPPPAELAKLFPSYEIVNEAYRFQFGKLLKPKEIIVFSR